MRATTAGNVLVGALGVGLAGWVVWSGRGEPEAPLIVAWLACLVLLLVRTPGAAPLLAGGVTLAWASSWPEPAAPIEQAPAMVAMALGAARAGVREWSRYIPLLLGLMLVATFSGGRGGPDPMVARLMEWFPVPFEVAKTLVVLARKSLHVLFYGFLAWAAARWWLGATPEGCRTKAACFGIAMGLVAACTDEGRQSLTAGRGGFVGDVFLDLAGMLLMTSPFWWSRRPRPGVPR